MRATASNTRNVCERCDQVKPYVMATVFQGDGSGRFRFLCASCERIEMWYSQRRLFEMPKPQPVDEIEPEELEEAPPLVLPQMNLFGGD